MNVVRWSLFSLGLKFDLVRCEVVFVWFVVEIKLGEDGRYGSMMLC